mmetsp:Transcript_40192/g.93139  ORF Transcript_40192/g.93139 Transcript_40192/m.93139 type:complete len:262 (-) Transcript_40192:81-866(-)
MMNLRLLCLLAGVAALEGGRLVRAPLGRTALLNSAAWTQVRASVRACAAEVDISSLRAGEIKRRLAARGISTASVFEKDELVRLLFNAERAQQTAVTVDATGKQGPTVLSGGLRVRAKWRDCVEIIRTAAQDAALLKGDTSWSPSPGSSPASIIARLAASSGKRPRIAGGQSAVTSRPTAQVAANTVDVRGQFAESAVDAVETQISKANQYGAIYVIHGHGTGRLREACREALAAHPFVSRIADAPDSQGGRGCTIAYLKD